VESCEIGKTPIVGDGLHLSIGIAERADIGVGQVMDTLPGAKIVCHDPDSPLGLVATRRPEERAWLRKLSKTNSD
jgi:hypothetical protein